MKKIILPLFSFLFFVSCHHQDEITSSEAIDLTEATKNEMQVTSPQPGDEWKPGTTQIIKWNSPTGIQSVQIQLYRKSDFKKIISEQTINNGSFTWVVPTDLVNSIHYRIKIIAVDRPVISSISDFFFIRTDKLIVLD